MRIVLWTVRGDRASALSGGYACDCRMILSTAAFHPASCCEELVRFLPASVVFSWLRVRTGLALKTLDDSCCAVGRLLEYSGVSDVGTTGSIVTEKSE